MPMLPPVLRRNREFVWRGVALLLALRLAPGWLGAPLPPWTLTGLAVALWALAGFQTERPLKIAAAVAGATAIAGLWYWDLPYTFLSFAALWAVLWCAPAVLRAGQEHSSELKRSAGQQTLWLQRATREAERRPRMAEAVGVAVVLGAAVIALGPFWHDGIMGGDDAKWYTAVVADHLEQWREGLGPVFVGQTRLAAVGTVFPLRVAPYLQHFTVFLDAVTGRSLSPYFLLNIVVVLSAVLGSLSAYFCLRSLLPRRSAEACLLAVLYTWSPGIIGLAYAGQLFMSTMTWPFLPVVFAGVVHVCRGGGAGAWLMVAAGCAGCWLGHSPIGFWATACAGSVLAVWWLFTPGKVRHLAWGAGAGLLMSGLCGYVFVSVAVLAPREVPPTLAEAVVRSLRATFPAVLFPVSAGAGELSDIQLGYGLWLLLGWSVFEGWRQKRVEGRALAFCAAGLVALVLPVPFLNAGLWHLIPQSIVNVTNAAPGQRLYPLLAACSVVFAAAVLSTLLRERPQRRGLVLCGLLGAVLWSGLELRPFLARAKRLANTTAASEQLLRPENLPLSRYSLSLLSEDKWFFSHGVVDYALEQRILAPDMKSYLATNLGAIAPGFDFAVAPDTRPRLNTMLTGRTDAGDPSWVWLEPKLTLQPGQHLLLAFDFRDLPYTGVLQLSGPGFKREYTLPLSGEKYAFGSGPQSARAIPLKTSGTEPVAVNLNFINQDPATPSARYERFAGYRLIPYNPAQLPIRLKTYLPYEAEVRSPAAGWLETFRYYIPGWTAEVNGKPVDVKRSPHDLVAVPIEAGESTVRLVYSPPAPLWLSYVLAWVCWAAVGAFCLVRLWRGVFAAKRL